MEVKMSEPHDVTPDEPERNSDKDSAKRIDGESGETPGQEIPYLRWRVELSPDAIRSLNSIQRRMAEIVRPSFQEAVSKITRQYPLLPKIESPAVSEMARRAAEINLAPISDAITAYWRSQIPRIDISQLTPQFEALRTIAERLRRLIPDNLRGLSVEELRRVAEISAAERWALAWAPRPDIVQAVLAADSAETRQKVLVQWTPEILDDCEDVLHAVEAPALAELSDFALQAVGACRAGHEGAAQALATNVLDTAIDKHLGTVLQLTTSGATRKAKEAFGQQLDDEATLLLWRRIVSCGGIPPSYDSYVYEERAPWYSRHGTAHCVNGNLYSTANALRSILMVTSLLRWMSEEMGYSVSES
jgi:hypothetical protein